MFFIGHMDEHYNAAFSLNQNDCEFSRKIKNSVTQLENVPKYFSRYGTFFVPWPQEAFLR